MSEDKKPYDPLSDSFNVESDIIPAENVVFDELIENPNDEVKKFRENVDADFTYTRNNIIATIEKANRALDRAIDLASASQQARAYEVVFNAVKIMTDANQSLMDLSKKSKELKALEMIVPDEKPTTVNNNMFIGSMEELQKMLKEVGVDSGMRTIK